MIAYKFIETLFESVLGQSKAIGGRFFVGHRYGLQEINYDLLGQVMGEIATKDKKKYPLSLLAPPHSRGVTNGDKIDPGWERYRIIIFFMNANAHVDAGTARRHPSYGTTTHSVLEDWHDMKRAAMAFYNKLIEIQRKKPSNGKIFRIPPNTYLMIPISKIGADGASGVRFDFDLDLFQGCEFDDDYSEFNYPSVDKFEDNHPEHKL